jgi:hypothetical protein
VENDIVKGIAKALRDTFGPGYRIYQNDIEQGFQTPCFFILSMKATPSPLGKDRFLLKSPFDVHFFPEDEKDNAVMQAIAWQLWQALEFITLPGGDKLHGTSMSWEVQDDVLHFFVSFNMTLRRIDLPEKMGELHMEVNQ